MRGGQAFPTGASLPVNVKVAYRSGAYVTATVFGQRASATMSAAEAIGRLAGKLEGLLKLDIGTLQACDLPDEAGPGYSVWQIKRSDEKTGLSEPNFICAGHEFDVRSRQ